MLKRWCDLTAEEIEWLVNQIDFKELDKGLKEDCNKLIPIVDNAIMLAELNQEGE